MKRNYNLKLLAALCVVGGAWLWPIAEARADQTNTIHGAPGSVHILHIDGNCPFGYAWSAQVTEGDASIEPPTQGFAEGPTRIPVSMGITNATVVVTIVDSLNCGGFTNALTFHLVPDTSAPQTAANTQTHNQGDPVNPFTGELIRTEAPDLYLGGPMPLMFQRCYASRLRRDALLYSSLGANWSHNFDFSLVRVANNISVVTWQGRVARFTKNGANWNLIGDLSTPFQLIESGTNYFFGDPSVNLVYTFNTNGQMTVIEDGHGNAHTLAYNSKRLLTSVSDGLGRTLTFSYGFMFDLTQVSDGARNIGIQAGGSFNGLQSITDPGSSMYYNYVADGDGYFVLLRRVDRSGNGGENLACDYNTNGQVVAQFWSSHPSPGSTYSNVFNYVANTATVTDPFGNTRVYACDSGGRQLAETNEAGKTQFFSYDSFGRRIAITNRLGEVTRIAYHAPSGRISAITRSDGKTTSFEYSSRVFHGITLYDPGKTTFPDGTTEIYARDSNGNLTAFTDQSGRTTTFACNSRGQLLSCTNTAGGVTTYTYNADGTLASARDPAANLTTFGYDPLRRLVALTNADGTVATWQYNSEDQVTALQDASGAFRQFTYGPRYNYITTFSDAKTNLWNIDYDSAASALYTITDPADGVFGYIYDALERVSKFVDLRRGGATVDFAFDSCGRMISTTDFDGNTNRFGYDDEDRIVNTTDPLGNSSSVTHDNLGRVTDFTSPLTNVTHMDYDTLGHSVALRAPESLTVFWSYDAVGRLRRTGVGYAAADYTRDALGLLKDIRDPNGQLWSSASDTSGRAISRTDPLGNETGFSWDNRNRPATVTYPGGIGSVNITYDEVGRVTRRQYSDGTDLQFSYDPDGQLLAANGISFAYDKRSQMTNANGIAITRDAAGRIETMTLAPGKTVTYAYDNRDLVTSVQDWLGGMTAFAYDAAGRMTNITRPNGVNGVYSYDAEGRIATIHEGGIVALTFTRDHDGRVKQMDRTAPVASAPPAPADFTFDAASQVSGFQYDALGRLLHDSTRDYQWDLASRLMGYTDDVSTVSFTYDALGNRLTQTNGSVNHEYVWNYALGLPSVSIEKQNGADARYYVHAPDGSLLYSVDANTDARLFYHYDETGNALALTDDAGTVAAGYAWGAYGELTGASGTADNPFTWQGRWGVMAEAGTGLFYHRARFYDSSSARFLSRDPAPSLDPRRINPYQYAMGNPLRYADADGLAPTAADVQATVAKNTVNVTGAAGTTLSIVGDAVKTSYDQARIFSRLGNSVPDNIFDINAAYKAFKDDERLGKLNLLVNGEKIGADGVRITSGVSAKTALKHAGTALQIISIVGTASDLDQNLGTARADWSKSVQAANRQGDLMRENAWNAYNNKTITEPTLRLRLAEADLTVMRAMNSADMNWWVDLPINATKYLGQTLDSFLPDPTGGAILPSNLQFSNQ